MESLARQGVADERQERVKGARAAHASAAAARLVLPRGAHRLMVDAEGGGDGPDLPVLAEREAPDLRPVAASSGSAAPSSKQSAVEPGDCLEADPVAGGPHLEERAGQLDTLLRRAPRLVQRGAVGIVVTAFVAALGAWLAL